MSGESGRNQRGRAWLLLVLAPLAAAFALLFAPPARSSAPRRAAVAAHVPAAASGRVLAGQAPPAGEAVLRDSRPLVLPLAPAPDPTPALPLPRVRATLQRSTPSRLAAEPFVVPAGHAVVRWRRHVPRMDSGDPPRARALEI